MTTHELHFVAQLILCLCWTASTGAVAPLRAAEQSRPVQADTLALNTSGSGFEATGLRNYRVFRCGTAVDSVKSIFPGLLNPQNADAEGSYRPLNAMMDIRVPELDYMLDGFDPDSILPGTKAYQSIRGVIMASPEMQNILDGNSLFYQVSLDPNAISFQAFEVSFPWTRSTVSAKGEASNCEESVRFTKAAYEAGCEFAKTMNRRAWSPGTTLDYKLANDVDFYSVSALTRTSKDTAAGTVSLLVLLYSVEDEALVAESMPAVSYRRRAFSRP